MRYKGLEIVLESEEEYQNADNTMYYVYRVGDCKMTFTQDLEYGTVGSVGFMQHDMGPLEFLRKGNKFKDIGIFIWTYQDDAAIGSYPYRYLISTESHPMHSPALPPFMEIGEVRVHSKVMRESSFLNDNSRRFWETLEEACGILEAIEEFFKTSRHYEVYCKGQGIEVAKGADGERLDELIAGAERKCSGVNKDLDNGKLTATRQEPR